MLEYVKGLLRGWKVRLTDIQPEYIDSPVLSCLSKRCQFSDWGFGHLYASLRYLEFCCHKNIFFKRFYPCKYKKFLDGNMILTGLGQIN